MTSGLPAGHLKKTGQHIPYEGILLYNIKMRKNKACLPQGHVPAAN
jgi:hypothetical protein